MGGILDSCNGAWWVELCLAAGTSQESHQQPGPLFLTVVAVCSSSLQTALNLVLISPLHSLPLQTLAWPFLGWALSCLLTRLSDLPYFTGQQLAVGQGHAHVRAARLRRREGRSPERPAASWAKNG